MSAKNRASLIDKLFKVAKKQYTFTAPPSSRSVLEHMLYGCCVENSNHEAADEALAKLQENFCDWNEVRVTTAEELADVGRGLAQPLEAARSLKRTLFGVFETYFTFDIDFLKKENLGKAVQSFENFKGISPFVVSYVAQNGLGGHSIPIDRSMLSLFYVLGIISEAEAASGRVPGLERAIPKTKGVEFFNVVHQLAVAFAASPFSKNLRDVLLKVNAGAKERFPKRASRKKVEADKPASKPETKSAAIETKADKKVAAKKGATPKTASPKAKVAAKKTAKKTTAKKTTKKAAPKKVTKKSVVKKKATKKAKATPKASKATPRKTAKSGKAGVKKKSPTKRLSKKKPR